MGIPGHSGGATTLARIIPREGHRLPTPRHRSFSWGKAQSFPRQKEGPAGKDWQTRTERSPGELASGRHFPNHHVLPEPGRGQKELY
jgi:hypothetical protein